MEQVSAQRTRNSTKPAEVLSIQYLRGFAALAVLASHALQWPLAAMNPAFLKTGRLGVDVFFVISGFIITMIAGDGPIAPLTFLKRRAWRIAPIYWIATALVAVLALALPHQFRTTVPTIQGFIESLLFIPSETPKAPLLALGWTLDYEAFFYLVFAALFFVRSETRTLILCAVFAVLIAIGQVSHGGMVQNFYTSASLLGFTLGTVLAQAWRHGLVAHIFKGPLSGAMAFIPPVLLIAYYAIPSNEVGGDVPLAFHILLSLTAVSIVLTGLGLEARGRLPRSAICKYFGDASYSIYLFHLFPLGALWAVAKPRLPIAEPAIYLLVSAGIIVVSLAFGLAAHRVLEKPLLALGKRKRTVPTAQPVYA